MMNSHFSTRSASVAFHMSWGEAVASLSTHRTMPPFIMHPAAREYNCGALPARRLAGWPGQSRLPIVAGSASPRQIVASAVSASAWRSMPPPIPASTSEGIGHLAARGWTDITGLAIPPEGGLRNSLRDRSSCRGGGGEFAGSSHQPPAYRIGGAAAEDRFRVGTVGEHFAREQKPSGQNDDNDDRLAACTRCACLRRECQAATKRCDPANDGRSNRGRLVVRRPPDGHSAEHDSC